MVEIYRAEAQDLNEFVEIVLEYRPSWEEEYNVSNSVREDEDFFYLDIEADEDLSEDIVELGNLLNARVTGIGGEAERYFLSVGKNSL
ncbi:hypothetical protein [Candidatus Nanohalovita haloferacivicina]|uniref:hypothetical protein n=1 Tax=Candidatus Nanohalovita haloferacivicina TaxID=2978046 RepID=UPI00325FA068|nr:hypothetical protein HBNXNv_0274 [Candidatus Nanohalobia archaeon BNXNv]